MCLNFIRYVCMDVLYILYLLNQTWAINNEILLFLMVLMLVTGTLNGVKYKKKGKNHFNRNYTFYSIHHRYMSFDLNHNHFPFIINEILCLQRLFAVNSNLMNSLDWLIMSTKLVDKMKYTISTVWYWLHILIYQ